MVGKSAGPKNDTSSHYSGNSSSDNDIDTAVAVRAPDCCRKCRFVGGRRYRLAKAPKLGVPDYGRKCRPGGGRSVRSPDYGRKCRIVAGMRYRLAKTSAVRVSPVKVSPAIDVSETASSSPPARGGAAIKSVSAAVVGGVYLAAAFAFAIMSGVAVYFAATVVISAWFGVALTLVPTDGIDIGQTPTTRNRSGRRVAGRRRARRHSRGRAGRSYLKRCPARRGKASHKRRCCHGFSSGSGFRRRFGLGFIQGGARPGDEEATNEAGAFFPNILHADVSKHSIICHVSHGRSGRLFPCV